MNHPISSKSNVIVVVITVGYLLPIIIIMGKVKADEEYDNDK